jgi:hypothetical protein
VGGVTATPAAEVATPATTARGAGYALAAAAWRSRRLVSSSSETSTSSGSRCNVVASTRTVSNSSRAESNQGVAVGAPKQREAYFPQPIAQQLAHDGALEVDADALVAHERVQELRGQRPDRDHPPALLPPPAPAPAPAPEPEPAPAPAPAPAPPAPVPVPQAAACSSWCSVINAMAEATDEKRATRGPASSLALSHPTRVSPSRESSWQRKHSASGVGRGPRSIPCASCSCGRTTEEPCT